jgi:glycosyltransferase involved in cell wall biosynthesis
MKKVIFIGNYPEDIDRDISGPERVTYKIIESISNLNGYDTYVIMQHRLRNICAPTIVKQQIDENNNRKFKIIRVHFFKLLFLLIKIDPDIIHISGISYYAIIALLFSIVNKKVKVIYTAHSILATEKRYGDTFSLIDWTTEWLTFKYSNLITTVSKLMRNNIISEYGIDPDKIKTVPNGFDLKLLENPPESDFFKTEYGISEVVILYVGRFTKDKGFEFLLKGILSMKSSNFKLVMIGNPTPFSSRLLYEYGLSNDPRIVIIGRLNQKELANAYSSCCLLVLPSLFESFGLAAIEAMGFSKPVIVSDKAGVSEIIINGCNGTVISYDDVEAFACAIDELLNDGVKRAYIGANAYKTAHAYCYDNIIENYISLYDGL